MNKQFWMRSLLATLAMVVVDVAFSVTQPNRYSIENIFWDAISGLMIAVTMNLVAMNSYRKGLGLAWSVWLISFGIGTFNILIEAWIFNVTGTSSTLLALVQGGLKFGVMAAVLSFAFPLLEIDIVRNHLSKRGISQWFWRIGVGVLLYVFLYMLAGMILQATLPEISNYYRGKMPALSVIINTQFFRGLIFVGIAIFVQRSLVASGKSFQALLIGLIFSILGGVAPLIPANNFMPAAIRLGHGFEVGISNFFYGFILGYILFRVRVDKK